MKTILTAIIILMSTLCYSQEEIKLPDLDTENKVYILKFSPDPQNEKVISSYMKGETENDSLRFWAEGTTLLQKVMVTVITTDKNSSIKVDIVKDNWEDSKINGYTKKGLFQESFETAGKFGVVITSPKPNISFQLAVWTTGENMPFMGNLYYPASEEAASRRGQMITDVNLTSQQQNGVLSNDSNTILYLIIGFFCIIIFLLVLLLVKKKAAKIVIMRLRDINHMKIVPPAVIKDTVIRRPSNGTRKAVKKEEPIIIKASIAPVSLFFR